MRHYLYGCITVHLTFLLLPVYLYFLLLRWACTLCSATLKILIMNKKSILLAAGFLLVAVTGFTQVGVGTTTPHGSAVLDLKSTSKGLLIPRMSTAERKAIVTPAEGLLVFDLDKSTIYFFNGGKWEAMLVTSSDANNPPVGRSAADGMPADNFGVSARISGNYAIIGASLDDNGNKADQGAAYIFERRGGSWSEQAKLTAADGAAGDKFGSSVSIDGDYAIVGAPKGSGGYFLQGAAYVFVRIGATWVQQAKLNSADGVIGESFGTSVSINGDYAIVGNPNATITYANDGAAYVFVRSGSNWLQQAKLSYFGSQYNDNFGNSVSIFGNYAIVGAPFFDWTLANQGGVFVFLRTGTTWAWQMRITAVDGGADDHFGAAVSLNNDYAIIGAPGDDGAYTDQGSAYIYLRNGTTWSKQEKMYANDNQLNANYGNSVDIEGEYAIVGAIYQNVAGSPYHVQEGAAEIYRRTGISWGLLRVVKDGSGQAMGFFGSAVGVSGFNYIIGAIGKNNGKGEVSFLNIE